MLDCHIIVANDTPEAWLAQCLDSVQDAIDRAGYPVALHLVPFVPGHMGQARAAGYARGSYPYVTCVDDDDYVLPHAFAALAEPLAKQPDAIFPRQYHLQNGKRCIGLQRHHLAVYRRDVVMDLSAWPCCEDMVQRAHALKYPHIIDVEQPLYVHRLYTTSKARTLRRRMPEIVEAAHG